MDLSASERFGNFLKEAWGRSNKTLRQIEKEIGAGSVDAWHEYRAFPKPEKLPLIAQAYNVDLKELEGVYHASKAARRQERPHRSFATRRVSERV